MEYRGGILIANSDLYHHGILGQKWGRRNGPPYPLGLSAHSSAEKKAGWRKSLKSTKSSSYRGGSGRMTLRDRIKINKEQREAAKKQREFNKKPLKEREKIWKEENKKYYTENKDRMLKNAKDNDQYDMEFLERTSDEWSSKSKKDKIKDYEKYLDKMATDGKTEDRYGSIFNNKKSKDKAAKANAKKIVEERLKDKEADEFFEKNKEKILRSNKAKDVLANQARLTNQELNDAVNRMDLNARIADHAAKQTMTAWKKIDKTIRGPVKDMVDWTDIGIRAWNDMAKIYNTTSAGKKERLPLVGQGGDNNQKK